MVWIITGRAWRNHYPSVNLRSRDIRNLSIRSSLVLLFPTLNPSLIILRT
jgi:hypothetical protein